VSGSQPTADDLVAKALELTINDAQTEPMNLTRRVFRHVNTLIKVHRLSPRPKSGGSADVVSIVDDRLQSLSLLSRQVFLLTSVERFADSDVCSILQLRGTELDSARQLARREMARQIHPNVLILEDDAFTAADIQYQLTDAGHSVVGVAATHREAIELAVIKPIDIVLADVQLADGGNGIEAVKQICATKHVPAIYLTAFPERLKECAASIKKSCVAKPFLLDQIESLLVDKLFLPATNPRVPLVIASR